MPTENIFVYCLRQIQRCTTCGSVILSAIFMVILMSKNSNAEQFSVAFYYGVAPPLKELSSFSAVVVEPGNLVITPDMLDKNKKLKSGLFAYISAGEVNTTRPYFPDIPASLILGENAAWSSVVVDQASPRWRTFFMSRIFVPLWRQGWRNFFVDTLDSYQLFAQTDEARKAQQQGLILTIKEIKRRYPEARLIFNRGFELFPEVAPSVYAIAAESLYRRYDAVQKAYVRVPEEDRAWLLAKLEKVRDEHQLPVISIDYIDPATTDLCAAVRETAVRIRANGFTPWITNGKVDSLMQLRCDP